MKDRLRKRVFRIIDVAELADVRSHRFDVFIVILIAINIAAVIIGSIAEFQIVYGVWLNSLALVSVVLFTIEYLTRIWTSVEHPSGNYHHPVTGRLKYLISPLMLADLLALVPFYLFLFPALD